jgi:site-specific DNA-methyltransferase (adenine-specific)
MAHRSESAVPLTVRVRRITDLARLPRRHPPASVQLYWLPWGRSERDAAGFTGTGRFLLNHAAALDEGSVVCVLTTPGDAAGLLERAPAGLHYQLWIAVKLEPAQPGAAGELLNGHAALVVLSRSRGSLRHTRTRLAYTHCPACGRTTKDYGGKKHTYHPYGTLLSDVWRDEPCDPRFNIEPIIARLRDLFGVAPHQVLLVHDLRRCVELMPSTRPALLREGVRPSAPPRGHATIRLAHGDCLEAVREIPSSSIDYCFADPPYNIRKRYDRWDDGLDIQEYFRWCDQWMDELCRVVRPGCTVTLLNIPLWCVRHVHHLARCVHNMRFQHWIAWDGLSLPVRLIMPAHYGIVSFSKGPPRALPGMIRPPGDDAAGDAALQVHPEGYCLRASCMATHGAKRRRAMQPLTDLWHDIHRLKHNSRRADHPCQLPPALMRRLIALYTWRGETVLDPFNGAGTTTLVAAQMGRGAIGIELSADYHRLAEHRHADLKRGIDPFARSRAIPQAKNSRVERLPRRRYAVPKKVLQLEVRAIARALGRLPTRDEVAARARYPIAYFDEYFISWGEVCAAARNGGMSERPARSSGHHPLLFVADPGAPMPSRKQR